MALGVSATSCPRDARYVRYRWELPTSAAVPVIPDTMVEGKRVLLRSDSTLYRPCHQFRAFELIRRRAVLGPISEHYAYFGFEPDSGRAFEVLLMEDARGDGTSDSTAALVGRMVAGGAGVPALLRAPARRVVDSAELSAKWCKPR